ncbi:MAG: hypothetical protein JNL12_08270 [Planctomycetes bacterium]|nr:hypothetical protein [Planctomycetota bacterium]
MVQRVAKFVLVAKIRGMLTLLGRALAGCLTGFCLAQAPAGALVGVVAPRVAAGRPLLWVLRDGGSPDLVVQPLADGAVRYFAWCEAGQPGRVHGGANDAGLGIAGAPVFVADGAAGAGADLALCALLKEALRSCRDVAAVEALLRSSDAKGRTFAANVVAIDASGTAALFEVRADASTRVDAATAERGVIVRGGSFPTPEAQADERQRLAEAVFARAPADGVSASFVLQQVARDLTLPTGAPHPRDGRLDTRATLHRQSTTGALVAQGVTNGEDVGWTTLWVSLGQPLFTAALPLFPAAGVVPRTVAGDPRSALAQASQRLQERFYAAADGAEPADLRWLRTDLLPPVRRDLMFHEAETTALLGEARANWRTAGERPPLPQLRQFQEAMAARLQQQLADLSARPTAPAATPPAEPKGK